MLQRRSQMQPTPSAPRSSNKRSAGGGESGKDNEGSTVSRGRATLPPITLLLRIFGLVFIDAVAMYFAYALIDQGLLPYAIGLVIVTLLINWVFLDDRLYPIRWFSPGLLLMLLMVVYPLGFTAYTALTNYSDGHLLTKEQVLAQFRGQYYQEEGAVSYTWTAYRNPDGSFLLVFEDPDGNRLAGNERDGLRPLDTADDLPATLSDSSGKEYGKLELTQTLQYLDTLTRLQMRTVEGEKLVRVTGLGRATESLPKYTYDPSTEQLTDRQTGVVYTPVRGTFTAPDGKTLSPGYSVVVGFDNFWRILT